MKNQIKVYLILAFKGNCPNSNSFHVLNQEFRHSTYIVELKCVPPNSTALYIISYLLVLPFPTALKIPTLKSIQAPDLKMNTVLYALMLNSILITLTAGKYNQSFNSG